WRFLLKPLLPTTKSRCVGERLDDNNNIPRFHKVEFGEGRVLKPMFTRLLTFSSFTMTFVVLYGSYQLGEVNEAEEE
ncbi:hypothetical protein KY289_002863, partial [Solanum tuberosum]